MRTMPKIKRCPTCNGLNLLLVNGISYKNDFKSLQEWTLKKIFNCRKCKIELGLFLHNKNQQENLIWIDWIKFEDNYYDRLLKLEKDKKKYVKHKSDQKYKDTLKEIKDIQNKIRLDQIKLKIKFKIENKPMLIKHVY